MAKASDEVPDAMMSKTDAVKASIEAGNETAKTGVPYIKETFKIDISANTFNTTKANLKKKNGLAGGGKRRGRKPGSKNKPKVQGSEPQVRSEAQGQRVGNGSVGVALARDVKKLVDQYGAAAVKEMADVFGA